MGVAILAAQKPNWRSMSNHSGKTGSYDEFTELATLSVIVQRVHELDSHNFYRVRDNIRASGYAANIEEHSPHLKKPSYLVGCS
ncbi:uncharacterized protein N7479_002656 [Penicillium vulpinum]|uniref:uncharacterized protein n=1 Tax=Penicillium vulpinum TaxID=29845 RepID=UPI002547BF1D|nr:uncharacterized protein N7479_002656 [Penicillium vulpinum]KAJ5972738.1 hypothetical protein N7479_002656 [Penicillium vulpinum]